MICLTEFGRKLKCESFHTPEKLMYNLNFVAKLMNFCLFFLLNTLNTKSFFNELLCTFSPTSSYYVYMDLYAVEVGVIQHQYKYSLMERSLNSLRKPSSYFWNISSSVDWLCRKYPFTRCPRLATNKKTAQRGAVYVLNVTHVVLLMTKTRVAH